MQSTVRRACVRLAAPLAMMAPLALAGAMPAQGDPRYDACFSRCIKSPEDPYHCGQWCAEAHTAWKWQQMQSGAGTADGQTSRRPAKATAVSFTTSEHQKSALSGSETRLAAMNSVNADCSPGSLPKVRVVTKPASGSVRIEPVKITVNRQATNHRAHCNGKIIGAVAVLYKSKEQYVGADKVVLDVDFRNGGVNRYTYTINVH